ncbi:hypothetical protein L3X38_009409 [Prunus dulcis]|uniref:MULE transposase domain-containing protein n=1 Tax=Prunus dulcis TaxID=3755 RepID=A0AAD4WDS8_PRUDU|nr:hypothetical protein L3X38_009409 [Prunus dulcis]
MEDAQLEEHVYEQVDDEGTETDDGEGADEEDDIKDPDLSDYREYSPTLVCIWSSSSEDEAIANLRRRRRKRMPKGENFRPEIDRRRNPGTTIVIKSELEGDRPGFERLYICLAACKKGFLDGCTPAIYLDDTQVKCPHPGQLLTAIGVDANNDIFPIGYVYLEIESVNSWVWFLELLVADLEIANSNGYIFISDK